MVKHLLKSVFYTIMWIYSFVNLVVKKITNGNGIILINTPTHGNIGDQAIAAAELEFIHRIISNKKVFVITESEWRFHKHLIKKCITKKQLILIHGGGYIGTLWENEANAAFEIMLLFPDNNKILMPQTAYYDNPSRYENDKELFKKIRNINVFSRDEQSYKVFTEELGLPYDRVYLVPDIVTTYRLPKNIKCKRSVDLLFVMRSDIEKVTDTEILSEIMGFAQKSHLTFKITDMFEKSFFYPLRNYFIHNKIQEFAAAKCVITDRLHGMYFSAITGTPCIALDNVSKKVSGGHMWLKKYCQINFVKNETELKELFCKDFIDNCTVFTFDFLDDKFSELIDMIKCYA